MSTPDYAAQLGFHSVAAPIAFAILYLPFCGWFFLQLIRRFTHANVALAMFCQIRMVAYVIRAILANSDSAGQNLGLVIADEILLGVGFLGLLLTAYLLVNERLLYLDLPEPVGIARLARNRWVFHGILMGAVVLGIIGTTKSFDTDPSTRSTGATLRKAGSIIFLALTVLLALQTFIMVRSESEAYENPGHTSQSLGARHGHFILTAIAMLLLIREIFLVATLGDSSKANNEHYWYPFVATTELIAVMLYAIPGLVPPKSELPK